MGKSPPPARQPMTEAKKGGGALEAPQQLLTVTPDERNCNRECLPEIEPEHWRYFGVHSCDLDPIEEPPPRNVNLKIDEFNMVFDDAYG